MSNTYTTSRPAPTAARKATKKSRFVRVLSRKPNGELMVRIEERSVRSCRIDFYYVRSVPSDWGHAASWQKWECCGGDGTAYQTNTGGIAGRFINEETGEVVTEEGPACCNCPGFESHGHCKHIEATKALLAAGKLS